MGGEAEMKTKEREIGYKSGFELSERGKERLLGGEGDPFLFADWERIVFLHFLIEPGLLLPHVPPPLELELYDGQACVSLVALTMRRFRPPRTSSFAALLRPL